MKLEIFETVEVLGKNEAFRIAKLINKKPNATLCLAAGGSTICVFNELIKMYEAGLVSFDRARFIGLDDLYGMKKYKGTAKSILDDTFFNRVNFNEENMRLFDSNTDNANRECEEIERKIQEWDGIDYLLLGVGMNGHVGLNEPGVDFSLGAHLNELAQITIDNSLKYTDDGILDVDYGLTLGFKNFKEAKEIVVIINGKHKAPIVEKILATEVTNEYPATFMKSIPGTRFVIDSDAASQIYKM